MPLFSIVMVVFNAEKTLEESIQSVLNQSYSDYEFLIIDGKSTDRTLDIIDNYREKITYFISEKDNGIYHAMNKSLQKVEGKWVFFLGADDVFLNHDILKIVSDDLLDADTIYYGDALFKKRNKLYDGIFSKYKFALRNLCHQTIFYPAKIIKKYGFDEKYTLLSDYATNLKIYKNHKFSYLKKSISIFNDDASSSRSIDEKFEADKFVLIRDNLGITPYLYARLRRIIKKILIPQ